MRSAQHKQVWSATRKRCPMFAPDLLHGSSDMYISFIQGSPMLVHAIEDAFLSSVEVTAIGELAIDRQSPFSFLPSSVCPSISAPVIFRASSNPIFRKAFVTERHPFEIATELKVRA